MGTKVKLPKELYDKAVKLAGLAGYSSVEEFVIHVLEKETEKLEGSGNEDEIKKRLKGLGYIS
jgi:hypothetical protein